MTEKTVYRCDFCGLEFEKETDCTNHEKMHVEIDEIIGSNYFYNSSYADEITIKMKDGKEFVYRRNY